MIMRFLKEHGLIAGILAFLALLPALWLNNAFVLHILIIALLYAFMGQAWNILGGFCGQFSVGHCAFFGVSAYCVTILFERFGLHPLAGALAGVVAAIGVAFIVGWISLHLTGTYFAMATVALVEMGRTLALYFRRMTHGDVGMSLPAKFSLSKIEYFYIILGLVMVSYIVAVAVRRSKYGTFMVAIRENEDRTRSLGIDTAQYKVLSAVISAALTAVGGAFYALYVLMIEPAVAFSFLVSIKMIMVVVIGGIGTLTGPLIGAFIAIVPDELIQSWLGGTYTGLAGAIYGTILIAVVKLRPQGVIGFVTRTRRSLVEPKMEKEEIPHGTS